MTSGKRSAKKTVYYVSWAEADQPTMRGSGKTGPKPPEEEEATPTEQIVMRCRNCGGHDVRGRTMNGMYTGKCAYCGTTTYEEGKDNGKR
jgi:hypothetical protein